MNILGSINEFEVEVIRERIKDVKRHKKQNGEVYGRLQYFSPQKIKKCLILVLYLQTIWFHFRIEK